MMKPCSERGCFVSGALGRVLRVARLAGVAPLCFEEKGGGWTVSLSQPWACYGYVLFTVVAVGTCSALVMDVSLPDAESVRTRTRTATVVWVLDTACMLLLGGACVLAAPAHARAMCRALNDVEKINMELSMRRWPPHQEARRKQFVYWWLVVTLLLCTVDEGIFIWRVHDTYTQVWVGCLYSFYYALHWVAHLRELALILLTLHVMHCLRDINQQLNDILKELSFGSEVPLMNLLNSSHVKTKNRKSFKNTVHSIIHSSGMPTPGMTQSYSQCAAVRRLAAAHARSCGVVRALDAAHAALVLIMLGSFLLHLVCSPYYFINYLFRDKVLASSGMKYAVVVCWQLLWCLYHTARLLLLIEPCHLTHIEMECSRELVSHLLRWPASQFDPLAEELDLFYKQLLLEPACYSAMQAATVSRALVATILGSITTYLVIILQLQ